MDRRIKKVILGQTQSLIIEPAPGLAESAVNEIKVLLEQGPLLPIKQQPVFELQDGKILMSEVDYRLAIELSLRLRSVRDIRLMIADIHAGSVGDLEKLWAKIHWHYYLPENAGVSLEVSSFQSKIYHENMIKERWQAALAEKSYKLESGSQFKLSLSQHGNRCKIDISLAGDDLYKRGYKTNFQTPAPLAEHYGAALLGDLSAYDFDEIFVPFAGSGSLGVEALMSFCQISPGVFPRSYALESLPCSPEASIRFLRKKLSDFALAQTYPYLSYMDISPEAHKAVQSNLNSVQKYLPELSFESKCEDFLKIPCDRFQGKSLCIPLNPPYGLRLDQKQGSKGLYHDIAKKLVDIAAVAKSVYSFCLVADEETYKVYRAILGDAYKETRHFNQGGRHVRAVFAQLVGM